MSEPTNLAENGGRFSGAPATLEPWLDFFPSPEELVIEGDKVRRGQDEAGLVFGPQGRCGLSHRGPDGRARRLTSAIDPRVEDRALIGQKDLNFNEGVLCLGLGLGYHLLELADRLDPQTPLWVMESRPELAACALLANDLSELLSRPGFRLFIGPFTGAPWVEDEKPPAQLIWRPATLRHFQDEYPGFGRPAGRAPQRALRRLLLFQSGYFLDKELANAALENGLEVEKWSFRRGPAADGEDFRRLLETIKTFRPELVLTVNHLGFDEQGLMDEMLSRLGLQAASWFVDSPVFILGPGRPSPCVSVFSWDKDYLPYLSSKGFSRAAYLPLATDPAYFHPGGENTGAAKSISFVGDSLTGATLKYLGKLGLTGIDQIRQNDFLDAADHLAAQFLTGPELLPAREDLLALAERFGLFPDPGQLTDLAALITWRASRRWRIAVLAGFKDRELTVAGDRHWLGLAPITAGRLKPPLDYYRELGDFYQSSLVNLNITSAQMKSGLNQRVFDVPASCSFLLTDRREQLFEHFEPGREVVTYDDPVEAGQLAAWYLKHPFSRQSIAQAAYKRVQQSHLYRHRLREMLSALKG